MGRAGVSSSAHYGNEHDQGDDDGRMNVCVAPRIDAPQVAEKP